MRMPFLFLFASFFSFAPISQSVSTPSKLGDYTLSLSVEDLSRSKSFYEKLGFEPIEGMGGIEQKWVLLTNGSTNIGLFQGMFPSNTISFQSEDARSIYQALKQEGLEMAFELGLDQSEGPCSFSLLDPDGNPILIDQH